MSRPYETVATVTLDGNEQDVTFRAHVAYVRGFAGCWGGAVDGLIEGRIGDTWVDIDDTDIDAADREHIIEMLCDECSEDDSRAWR